MNLEPNYLIWIALVILIIFNIIINYNDPFLYSNSKNCLFVKCKEYAFISGSASLFFDVCIAISLTLVNPIPYLPKYWVIPLVILYFMAIYTNYNQAQIVTKDEPFGVPPEGFFNKKTRIIFRSIILILYTFIFLGRLGTESQPTIKIQSLAEKFLYNRFGGFKKGNEVAFLLGWISLLSIPVSVLQLYKTIKYFPTNYNQPVSWSS